MAEIDKFLHVAAELEASDLHIKTGMTPRFRQSGRLEEAKDFAPLTAEQVAAMTSEILTEQQAEHFRTHREIDFTYGNADGRFRCNFFFDNCGPGAVFRRIPAKVPTLEQLNLPEEIEQFAHLRRGLVLITGSSGSGKTSTLAALVDVINQNYHRHVITLEDPIEYLHEDKLAVIHQRGMHDDIPDFQTGIMAALRQDPDAIVIGELRDLESIRRALTAAEIGILVFGTLHTNSAADSIDRIVDVFPSYEQSQVRTQLSESLAGVVSQFLLNRLNRPGRYPATEVLVGTPAVSAIIREGKTQEISTVIQGGRARGMHTLDDSLERLVRRRIVDAKEAALLARNKARFDEVMARM